MRRILHCAWGLAACLCLPGLLRGQALLPLAELPLAGEPGEMRAFAAGDAEGTLLLLQEGGQARLFSLDREGRLLGDFTLDALPDGSGLEVLGILPQDGRATLYLRELASGEVIALPLDRRQGPEPPLRLDIGARREPMSHWESFSMEGALFVLRIPPGGASLRLSRFNGGAAFESLEFPAADPALLERHRGQIAGFDTLSRQPWEAASAAAKAYRDSLGLWLSFDEPGYTHLIRVEPLAGRVSELRLARPEGALQGNSCLVRGQLLQLARTAEGLWLRSRPLGDSARWRDAPIGPQQMLLRAPQGFGEGTDSLPPAREDFWRRMTGGAPALWVAPVPAEGQAWELAAGWAEVAQQRGITGMLVSQQVRGAYLRLSPSGAGLPALALGAGRAQTGYAFRPLYAAFRREGRLCLGYYDPARGAYVLLEEK
jgi:hypothetical protein